MLTIGSFSFTPCVNQSGSVGILLIFFDSVNGTCQKQEFRSQRASEPSEPASQRASEPARQRDRETKTYTKQLALAKLNRENRFMHCNGFVAFKSNSAYFRGRLIFLC